MLYTNKRLQKTNRYKKYNALIDKCYKTSIEKEKKQQEFYKKVEFANLKTGESYQITHSFEKYYKKYTKSIEQKIYTIEALARKKGLIPVFITLTLPSEFHPFRSIEYKKNRLYTNLNPDFSFDSIAMAIKTGYDYLNTVYRILYKRVKNKVSNLMYIKVVEAHKTMIPHFHILFFIPKEENKILFKEFVKIINEFELNQTDFSQTSELKENIIDCNYKTNINHAAKYVMKYITKNLKNGADIFYARVLDGWKRIFKIRMITTSNLPLTLVEYRTIYYALDSEIKEALLKEAKVKQINLFYLILENLAKITTIKNMNDTIKRYRSLLRNRFIILKKIIRRQTDRGGYSYIINSFTFFIDRVPIYKKQKHIKKYI
jgi:hypothetical protein